GVRRAGGADARGRCGGQHRGATGEGMGRAHGSVHERGAGGDDDVAPQAWHPAGDPHGAGSRLPARPLTRRTRSLRGRIAVIGVVAFAAGMPISLVLPVFSDALFSATSCELNIEPCQAMFSRPARIVIIAAALVVVFLVVLLLAWLAARRALMPI